MFFVFPQAWFVWGGITWFAFANRKGTESPERIAERAARRQVQEQAERTYNDLVEKLRQQAGPEGFRAKRAGLEKLKTEYEQLSHAESRELEELKSTAQERQKQKFLDSFFIEAADIPGVGPGRKTALRSFGIETAADVNRHAVMQVRGFGPNLTRAVVDWRASCERRFTFNPNTAVTEADRNAVRSKYAARRRVIEGVLSVAPAELASFTQTATARANQLRAQTENAARELAQARADLAVL
jgi:DNA-binding helix-hairpin-helix protein with protein kinase domain